MITKKLFNVFDDLTLPGRMAGIRSEIDPEFEQIAPRIQDILQKAIGQPVYAHVAKHLRRFKNPPVDTWVAFSTNPRGYKMLPHIEVGFWDDQFFVWLSVLLEGKATVSADELLQAGQQILTQNKGLDGSADHSAKAYYSLTKASLAKQTTRFERVKAGEWLVGKVYTMDDPIWEEPQELEHQILVTIEALAPQFAKLNHVI